MIQTPMDTLHQYPIRKTRKQKQAFRDAVCQYVKELGYSVSVEEGSFGARNVVIGNPNNTKYLVTAHYDTCAALPIPNFLMPCNVTVFVMQQIGLVCGIVLISALLGALAGLLLGEIAVPLVCSLILFGTIGLMIVGPANKQNANDNTSGVVTVLEIMRTLPEN